MEGEPHPEGKRKTGDSFGLFLFAGSFGGNTRFFETDISDGKNGLPKQPHVTFCIFIIFFVVTDVRYNCKSIKISKKEAGRN